MLRLAHSGFIRLLLIGSVLVLAGCAGYGGSNLKPGASVLSDVVASMGVPAMRWKDSDGSEQLAYPRGPAGTKTFMVFVRPDGVLERIENVLDMEHFARIEAGKSDMSSVLRLLGPVFAHNAVYFKARDELVWSWLFCDSWKTSRLSLTSCSMPQRGSCAQRTIAPIMEVGAMGRRGGATERERLPGSC